MTNYGVGMPAYGRLENNGLSSTGLDAMDSPKLKIAVTSPYSWPYFRGGNSLFHELAAYLASKGHAVNFVTSKPGRSRIKQQEGYTITYCRQFYHPLGFGFGIDKYEGYALSCLNVLLQNDFDIIHSMFPIDGFAASMNKTIKKTEFVFLLVGCEPLYLPTRFGKFMFTQAIRRAGEIIVPSRYVQSNLKEEFGLEGCLIPPPVNISRFNPMQNKDLQRPRILYTATLVRPRKRAALLVLAFQELLKDVPDAILELSGPVNEKIKYELLNSVGPKARNAIHILGPGKREDLPKLYSRAAITVLPSLKEPFGMVLLESLASGTPVVGTRSGAIPEFINNPDIGVLFDSDGGPKELAQAMRECLELSGQLGISQRCRKHAADYDWSVIGPQYEQVYSRLLSGCRHTKKDRKHFTSELLPAVNSNNKPKSVFDDVLDELEVVDDEYHRLDSQRLKCEYLLKQAVFKDMATSPDKGQKKALLICQETQPMGLILNKIGFTIFNPLIDTGMYPDINQIQTKLSFEKGIFDLIFMDDIISNFLYNPSFVLETVKELLKPEAKLVVMVSIAACAGMRMKLLPGKNMYPGFNDMHRRSFLAYREYPLDELKRILRQSGLKATKIKYFTAARALEPLSPISLGDFLKKEIGSMIKNMVPVKRGHIYLEASK